MASQPATSRDPVVEHFINTHMEFEVEVPLTKPPRLHVTIHLEAQGEGKCDEIAIQSVRLCPWPVCGG
jgi:hypothetical protein